MGTSGPHDSITPSLRDLQLDLRPGLYRPEAGFEDLLGDEADFGAAEALDRRAGAEAGDEVLGAVAAALAPLGR